MPTQCCLPQAGRLTGQISLLHHHSPHSVLPFQRILTADLRHRTDRSLITEVRRRQSETENVQIPRLAIMRIVGTAYHGGHIVISLGHEFSGGSSLQVRWPHVSYLE